MNWPGYPLCLEGVVLIRITHDQIDPAALDSILRDETSGAVVTFDGRVRNHHNGKAVNKLEYSCHESMAQKQLTKLAEKAKQRWGVDHVVAVHRVGEVGMGESAVWIGVASGHRSEAFEACRWLIDTIKHDVPIWKHETYEDGTDVWQEGCDCIPAGVKNTEKHKEHSH